MKLSDQVAIVTGAGRNIGEDVAKLFASRHAASWSGQGRQRFQQMAVAGTLFIDVEPLLEFPPRAVTG